MTDMEIFRKELDRLKEETAIGLSEWDNGVENGRMEVINALKEKIDSMQQEQELEGIEKEVAEGTVARINRKRIPIELKGEIKAKFRNEFNTIWQIIDGIQFANVAKHIIERVCLHFAAWGAYHLKNYIGISDDENQKIDTMQEKQTPHSPKVRETTGKLKECIDNITEESLTKARKQMKENPKECMYSKDNYADEDRKALCEGCEEECRYAPNILPVFDEGYWERLGKEPVSEDLVKVAEEYAKKHSILLGFDCDSEPIETGTDIKKAVIYGANWQKQQMMKNAVNGRVVSIFPIHWIEVTSYIKGYTLDEKVKLIIIKEE